MIFDTGQILFVLKTVTMMVIALTRKYVSMVSARRVADLMLIVKGEQNAIKIHAFLPVKWEIPVFQLNTAILTTMFASQNVHQIHIAMLDTNVPEDTASSLALNQINVQESINIVTSKCLIKLMTFCVIIVCPRDQ